MVQHQKEFRLEKGDLMLLTANVLLPPLAALGEIKQRSSPWRSRWSQPTETRSNAVGLASWERQNFQAVLSISTSQRTTPPAVYCHGWDNTARSNDR